MKCPHCKKEMIQDDSAMIFLHDERNLILKEIEKIRTKLTNTPKSEKNKRTKIVNLLNNKLKECSDNSASIKLLKHEIRLNSLSREEFLVKFYIKELMNIGYDRKKIIELANKSDSEWVLFEKTAKEKLELLKTKNTITKHNEWHTETGAYDPTGKKATDKITVGGRK